MSARRSDTIISQHQPEEASLLGYTIGFLSSVALTLVSFGAVELHQHHHLNITRNEIAAGLITMALVQFLVQLFFFLHLGRETKPRWRLVLFGLMILTVGTVVIGSLWIMSNLNYNMDPNHITKYLHSQDGL